MGISLSRPLDLAEEFRLRRWARMNYVAQPLRRQDWHPVVIDEMVSRDSEMSEPTTPRAPIRHEMHYN